jgi:hypothetical protein
MRFFLPLFLVALLADRPLFAQDQEPDTADAPAQDSLVLVDMARCHAAAAGASLPAETLLVIARAIRSELWSDSALVCFRGYAAQAADSGVALLEEARTLFDLSRAQEARERWLAGAGRARSAEARAQYRADIGWIATGEELVEFDSLPGDSLRGWVTDFWVSRDVADARAPGERLTEHYRRWWHVMRNYKGRRARRLRDIGSLRRAYRDSVDDRGLVYMRYGEPAEEATWNGATDAIDVRQPEGQRLIEAVDPQTRIANAQETLEGRIERIDELAAARPLPNISWRYDLPEGPLVLHFVAYRSAHYQLVESLTDAFGFGVGIRLSTGALSMSSRIGPGRTDPLLNIRSLFGSRSDIDPVYGTMSQRLDLGGGRGLTQERRRGRESMVTAVSTDRFAHHFDRALSPIVQTFALGPAPGAAGRVVVIFAVPGAPLVSGGRLRGQPFYPIRVRVVVSQGTRLVADLDTMRQFVAREGIADGRYLIGLAEVPVPPGEYRVQVVLAQAVGGAGAAMRVDSVRVPETAGPLTMSDIVVGRRGSGLSLRHRGRALPLNPLNAFTGSAAAELYYEVSGLAQGEEYQAQVELRREKGGKRAVSLAFTERATGPVTPVLQSVDLSTVRPGRYTLVVKVTSASGAEVSRTATLYLIEPRSYRDADEVVARTLAIRAAPEAPAAWPLPSTRADRIQVNSSGGRRVVKLDPLVRDDQGGDAGDLEVAVTVSPAAAGSADSLEVTWLVNGNGAESRRLVFAVQGDRHVDLGTGARHENAGMAAVDEYRMPLHAWVALLESPRAELYLDDVRFELSKKKELRLLRELMGLAAGR